MGYLTLRLVPSLQAIVSDYHTACDVWARLTTLYGTPGTALIFVDFMKVINWKFDASHDPSTSISQFLSLIQRLATHKIDLPEMVKAMFVLNALPKHWDGMASTMLMTFTTSTLTVENLMPKIMEEWRCRGASSSSVHMARSSLNKRKPMPKWQGSSSAGSSTSYKGSFHKKPKGKSSFRPNPQLLEQRIAPLQPQQQWPGQQPGQSRGGNWKRNAGKRKDGKAKKRAAMAVSGPSFATAAMAMIVEEMPELTIDESSIQSSQTTFPIRDKGKQRAIEIFPEQEELVSPDAECILSEQERFFESPEEFMDDSLDYGDPNEISFKTDDRYAVTVIPLLDRATRNTLNRICIRRVHE